jgi:hypothetical protein
VAGVRDTFKHVGNELLSRDLKYDRIGLAVGRPVLYSNIHETQTGQWRTRIVHYYSGDAVQGQGRQSKTPVLSLTFGR